MLHNLTAQYDIRLGVIISVLSAIPVVAFIYAAESAKLAGLRQKLADRARRVVRLAAFRPKPASGDNADAITTTIGAARDAYRQALRKGDDLALLAIVRLGRPPLV